MRHLNLNLIIKINRKCINCFFLSVMFFIFNVKLSII